jgi:capsular polysaccharide transport system ATP-binding protein
MIIVSHDPGYIREHCQRAAVLSAGTMHHFETMDESYDFYLSQQAA